MLLYADMARTTELGSFNGLGFRRVSHSSQSTTVMVIMNNASMALHELHSESLLWH